MSFFPDMGSETLIVAGDHIRAVGWLHPDHPFTRGATPPEFISKLKAFASLSKESTFALYLGSCCGLHECEFCPTASDRRDAVCGYRNFGVPSGEVLFVAPEMIVHYVEQHGYAPPAAFIAAVLSSPLPGTQAYWDATEVFRQPIVEQREKQRAKRLAEAAEQAKRQVVAPRVDPNMPRHSQFFQFICPLCAHSEEVGLWVPYKVCSQCGKGISIVQNSK
jgi:hypothetical protein